jgi:hypothetical protein
MVLSVTVGRRLRLAVAATRRGGDGDNIGWRWPMMRSNAVGENEAEQKWRGRRKEKERGGNP